MENSRLKTAFLRPFRLSAEIRLLKHTAGLPTYNALYAYIRIHAPSLPIFHSEKEQNVHTVAEAVGQFVFTISLFPFKFLIARDTVCSYSVSFIHFTLRRTVRLAIVRASLRTPKHKTPSQGLRANR